MPSSAGGCQDHNDADLTADQRGFKRPVDGRCDVGAVEFGVCGDGAVDVGEACDQGSDNSDTAADACRTTCVSPTCGDGVVDTDETCDDGNTEGGDGCDATCSIEDSPTIPPDGEEPSEGEGGCRVGDATISGGLLVCLTLLMFLLTVRRLRRAS